MAQSIKPKVFRYTKTDDGIDRAELMEIQVPIEKGVGVSLGLYQGPGKTLFGFMPGRNMNAKKVEEGIGRSSIGDELLFHEDE